MFDVMQTADFFPPPLRSYIVLTPALRWRVRSADCAKGRKGTVSVSTETGKGHTLLTPSCGICLVVDQFAYGNSNRSPEAAWQY